MNGKKYTEDEATSAALVAATLQLTAKGIPVIYYGEEVGLSGLNNYPYGLIDMTWISHWQQRTMSHISIIRIC